MTDLRNENTGLWLCDILDCSICRRSNTEVRNGLRVPVDLLHKADNGQVTTLCQLNPDDTYHVPLPALYGKHDGIFMKPHFDR